MASAGIGGAQGHTMTLVGVTHFGTAIVSKGGISGAGNVSDGFGAYILNSSIGATTVEILS